MLFTAMKMALDRGYDMESKSIICDDTLTFEANYPEIKTNIKQRLHDSLDLYKFDDETRQIRYHTEGPLVPIDNGKIPILILLSNPHPHSVRQGMFLSPNRVGRENPFWNTLRGTGYFKHIHPITVSMMIENKYDSPFRIFIAVLLSFPSNFPHELPDIFGMSVYRQMVISGKRKIEEFVTNHKIKNVICFGKAQYDTMASFSSPDKYTNVLIRGNIIKSNASLSNAVTIFLTFPTGWRFDENSKAFKTQSLKQIMETIMTASGHSLNERDDDQFVENTSYISKNRKSSTNVWFVVHHRDLWDIDNRLIGFYNKNQWELLEEGDLIIYYRAGVKAIMGIFRIIQKGVNLNKRFYMEDIAERTIHQCRLELLSDYTACHRPTTESRFSFFDSWVGARYGLGKQVFGANNNDLELILRDKSIINGILSGQ